MNTGFLTIIEDCIKKNWELPSLTDYEKKTYKYKDVGREIAKLHVLFDNSNIKKGDKIAIIGGNSANWAITYLGIMTYDAVLVPILHQLNPKNIHYIINHSETKMLFVEDTIWDNLIPSKMKNLHAVFSLVDFSLIQCASENYRYASENLNKLFEEKYPKGFTSENVNFYKEQSPEELALISYRSGEITSTGIMLPYRSLLSNLLFTLTITSVRDLKNKKTVCVVPMAHMESMVCDFLYEFASGCQIYFATDDAFIKNFPEILNKVKPDILVLTPAIVECIYNKNIQPIINRPIIKVLLMLPIIKSKIERDIKNKLIAAFGGNLIEILLGGASLNKEIENFLRRIKFPFSIGFGLTECGPILSYSNFRTHKLFSSGKVVDRMQIIIDSPDPKNIAGEILTKGDNLMLGYFKDEAATKKVFTKDGWMKTGDIATIDANGYLFIKGRSSNMIHGFNGQNIYLEEIETALTGMCLVQESLVLEAGGGKLEAFVYPNYGMLNTLNLKEKDLKDIMQKNRVEINKELPEYSQIDKIHIASKAFEKNPDLGIKRFLYQINKNDERSK